jgi:hypothetical protein
MTMAKHPTPWKVDDFGGLAPKYTYGGFQILDAAGQPVGFSENCAHSALFEMEEAEQIVRAVNAHDRLVMFLAQTRHLLEAEWRRPGEDGTPWPLEPEDANLLARVDEVLAAADQ